MDNQVLFFYAMLALAVVLTRIPYIGRFIRVIGTLVHETGHVVAAFIVGHQVKTVSLFDDLSGEAVTAGAKGWRKLGVAFAGYPFASLSAWMVFWLLYHHMEQWVLMVSLLLALFLLLLYIRNGFGIFWSLTFIALTAVILFYAHKEVQYGYALVLAMLLLADSLASPFVLLLIALKNPAGAGDATNLRKLTHVPELFWALLFALISTWITYQIISHFFPYLNTWLT
ncbi:MAG: M50 family metallopeptidase [Bacteroidales bacterium]